MNGTSGFGEVRTSTSRSSTNRLLREQRPQFGTGAWHRFRTHDRIALSSNIAQKRGRFLTPFPRHNRQERIRRQHAITIRLALLAALTGIFSPYCASSEDTVSVTPRSRDEVGILVDGIKGDVKVRDQVFRGSPGEQISIENFTAGAKTVIAYTQGRTPTLAAASSDPWTSGRDTTSVLFEAEYPIKVVFWIVKGPFDKGTTDKAKEFLHATNWIWSKEAQGLRLITEQEDPTIIRDATAMKNSAGNPLFGSATNPVSCTVAVKTDIGGNDDAINIYYVSYVATDDGPGLKSMSTACEGTNVVLLGEDADPDVLAHELGHLFALTHIDGDTVKHHFDNKNVMYPAPRGLATFLTEGQTLRSIVLDGSLVNSIFPGRNPKLSSNTNCRDDVGISNDTVATEQDSMCPPIWIRIWADKGTRGRTWEPDSCWKGCGAPVHMQIASRPETNNLSSNLALPPAVSDALQYYLDVRCLIPEKGQPMRKPLTELLVVAKQFKVEKALENRLLALLTQGPDKGLVKEIEEEAADDWMNLQTFQSSSRLKTYTTYKAPPILAGTKEGYLRARVRKTKQRYRERSAIALLTMNSPKGVRSVKEEAAKDKALRDLFETSGR
jgi:hypothetical protein